MDEMFEKSRLTRALVAIATMAAVFYVLGRTDGAKAVVASVATAVFAWAATCELEAFKTKLLLQNKQLDWKRDVLAKADACLFDLKSVYEDITISLVFKPAGETDDQWHKRASECWTKSIIEMDNLRREIWCIRVSVDNFDELDSMVKNISQELRGMIIVNDDLMFHLGVYKIQDLISKRDKLKGELTSLDERFQEEMRNMFNTHRASISV